MLPTVYMHLIGTCSLFLRVKSCLHCSRVYFWVVFGFELKQTTLGDTEYLYEPLSSETSVQLINLHVSLSDLSHKHAVSLCTIWRASKSHTAKSVSLNKSDAALECT